MGDHVILPSMTDQMILGVFKFLVECELRKNMDRTTDYRSGQQDGAIYMLTLMFGACGDTEAELAYDNKISWSHVTTQIAEEKLQTWIDTLSSVDDWDSIDIDRMQQEISQAVDAFALQHPKLLTDALRKYL